MISSNKTQRSILNMPRIAIPISIILFAVSIAFLIISITSSINGIGTYRSLFNQSSMVISMFCLTFGAIVLSIWDLFQRVTVGKRKKQQ
ncbi:hypothetical protein BLNAU_7568 [Blattamonas nauphoetae]|uniref:Uncharacterized protein n=1 Tax=Blattamonas nauphoetae TaxID=2049346 RepID=A0ABQ9Y100_9EUKA|nr:hypothetical protein BLNAU_7568 [Blattamonas nauphoetae]